MSTHSSPLRHEVAADSAPQSAARRCRQADPHAAIRGWLITLWLLVLMMVAVGGITRLTGSGLSIVHWKPVSGALPPLDAQAWQDAFDAYKSSPQFREVNAWMSLADFKRIFFWEYVHRLLGRLIGVAVFVPWLYFVLRKRMSARVMRRTASVFLLGGLQGFVGWYMVKSGLADEPRVSHLRLAMHLLLGMGVGQWIFWLALSLRSAPVERVTLRPSQRMLALGLLPLLALQVMYGAFMAGTHAGLLYSTFPDMNGHYSPATFVSGGALLPQLFNSPLLIHYTHRALALVVLLYIGALLYALRDEPRARRAGYVLVAALVAQLLLGAFTVLLHVPISIAALHQVGAYVLVSSAVALCHTLFGSTEALDAREVDDRDGGLARAGQDLRRA